MVLLLLLLCSLISLGYGSSTPRVEIFVMSKCPDAHFTELLFASVVEQYKNEGSSAGGQGQYLLSVAGRDVSVALEFITEDENGSCKHGVLECQGNEIELCIQETSSTPLLKFVKWYNMVPEQIGNLTTLPDTLTKFGFSHDEQGEIVKCVKDKGPSLLRDSSALARSLNITTSATIRINGNVEGVRDGGAWTYLNPNLDDGSDRAWIQFLKKHA